MIDIDNRGESEELLGVFHSRLSARSARSTADSYRGGVKRWLSWLEEHNIHPWDVRSTDLHDYLSRMLNDGYASDTIKVHRAGISAFYDECRRMAESRTLEIMKDVDPGDIPDNPADGVDLSEWKNMKKGSKKAQTLKEDTFYLLPEGVKQLEQNAVSPSTRNALIIKLLYQTGLRESELADTRLIDLDLDARSIRIRSDKSHLNRTVWYQPTLTPLIKHWINGGVRDALDPGGSSEYLLLSSQGNQLSEHSINRVIVDSAWDAGIQEIMYTDVAGRNRHKITAHTLRHSYAVQSVKNGMPTRWLQIVLGHKNLATTEDYLNVLDSDVRDAVRKYGAGSEEIE